MNNHPSDQSSREGQTEKQTGPSGKRIAMIRDHRGLTQAKLAQAVGISRQAMSRIEQDHVAIKYDLARRIARALHCDLLDFEAPLDAPMPRYRFHGGGSGTEATLVPIVRSEGE